MLLQQKRKQMEDFSKQSSSTGMDLNRNTFGKQLRNLSNIFVQTQVTAAAQNATELPSVKL